MRDFTRRRVIVNHIDEIWSADLVYIVNGTRGRSICSWLLMFSVIRMDKTFKGKRGETATDH